MLNVSHQILREFLKGGCVIPLCLIIKHLNHDQVLFLHVVHLETFLMHSILPLDLIK